MKLEERVNPTKSTMTTTATTNTTQTKTIYENNANKVVDIHVDTTSSPKTCNQQIRDIIKILCPFLPPTNLNICPLTGGLSNLLFLVTSSSSNNNNNNNADCPSVLVRIHPDNPHAGNDENNHKISLLPSFSIVDREIENQFASWLAKHGAAPTVYGRFSNGRVEHFYNNVRPIHWKEMSRYGSAIAIELSKFHQLQSPPATVLPKPTLREATIYETIDTWLEEAKLLVTRDGNSNRDSTNLLNLLEKEWIWLQQQLIDEPSSSDNPTVQLALTFIRRIAITHMDCQPLNILIDSSCKNHSDDKSKNTKEQPSTENIKLIDFEYSGWNPVAADIANTFCEYCEMSNLCADYDKEYPTVENQEEFFWHYCNEYYNNNNNKSEDEDVNRRTQSLSLLPHNVLKDRKSDEWKTYAMALSEEVGRYTLLSHLGWSIWSVLKSKEEDGVDFDYIVYAKHRMDGYEWSKKKFFVVKSD
jgi:thiamine kinase-like enzyme